VQFQICKKKTFTVLKLNKKVIPDFLKIDKMSTQEIPTDLGPLEAQEMIQNGKAYVLDVREAYELDMSALEGVIHISMGEIPARFGELPTALPCIVMCHHGMRSAQVIRYLNQVSSGSWINLTGGIDAWSREVDPGIPRY
jgi:rhodanese-related sulfurtransferase